MEGDKDGHMESMRTYGFESTPQLMQCVGGQCGDRISKNVD
jgi:hypothetical protein